MRLNFSFGTSAPKCTHRNVIDVHSNKIWITEHTFCIFTVKSAVWPYLTLYPPFYLPCTSKITNQKVWDERNRQIAGNMQYATQCQYRECGLRLSVIDAAKHLFLCIQIAQNVFHVKSKCVLYVVCFVFIFYSYCYYLCYCVCRCCAFGMNSVRIRCWPCLRCVCVCVLCGTCANSDVDREEDRVKNILQFYWFGIFPIVTYVLYYLLRIARMESHVAFVGVCLCECVCTCSCTSVHLLGCSCIWNLFK